MQIQTQKLLPKESNMHREIRLECLKNFPNNFSSNYQDEKAANIYTKIGFEEYGLQKNYLKIDDTYFNHKMMMIFKNQYIVF